MYLYEKGALSKETAGMEIQWGDSKVIVKLVELIIKQEGIGLLLSKGVKKMAEELGVDPNEARLDWIGMKIKPKFIRNSKLQPTDVYFIPA